MTLFHPKKAWDVFTQFHQVALSHLYWGACGQRGEAKTHGGGSLTQMVPIPPRVPAQFRFNVSGLDSGSGGGWGGVSPAVGLTVPLIPSPPAPPGRGQRGAVQGPTPHTLEGTDPAQGGRTPFSPLESSVVSIRDALGRAPRQVQGTPAEALTRTHPHGGKGRKKEAAGRHG